MNEIFTLDSRYYLLSILKRVFPISPFPKSFERYYAVMLLPAYCALKHRGLSETQMRNILLFVLAMAVDPSFERSLSWRIVDKAE